jgi:hypothetical protein
MPIRPNAGVCVHTPLSTAIIVHDMPDHRSRHCAYAVLKIGESRCQFLVQLVDHHEPTSLKRCGIFWNSTMLYILIRVNNGSNWLEQIQVRFVTGTELLQRALIHENLHNRNWAG